MTFNRSLILAVYLLAFIVSGLGGCRRESKGPLVEVASTQAHDPLDYFGQVGPDLAVPGYAPIETTEAEWKRLVRMQREDGIASLTAKERSALLTGILEFYLRKVDATSRAVIVNGVGSGRITEHYDQREGLFVVLLSQEQTASGFIAGWSDFVFPSSGDHHVALFVNVVASDSWVEEWIWSGEDAEWTCTQEADSGGLSFGSNEYLRNLTAILDEGTWSRVASGDREYEVFVRPYSESGDQRIWLDAQSLFPLRFEMSEIRDPRGAILQPARDITITSINPTESVSPPRESCD